MWNILKPIWLVVKEKNHFASSLVYTSNNQRDSKTYASQIRNWDEPDTEQLKQKIYASFFSIVKFTYKL